MNERERFLELLPFFVNGTLDAQGRSFVQAQLQRHPELRAQVEFHQQVQGHVVDAAERSLHGVPADVGYARIAARMAAQARPSAWRRWAESLSLGPWRLAQGLALGLFLGVGSMLALHQQAPDTAPARSAAPGLADGPLLRVGFHPQTTENEMRMALIEARAIIVAGPTRLGDYYLKPAGRVDDARAVLMRSRSVQRADVVPALPQELTE